MKMLTKRFFKYGTITAGLAALLAVVSVGLLQAADHSADAEMMVEVSFTNLTRGQIMSPIFIARHNDDADPLYRLSHPASDALAMMAEDADASGLLSAWDPDNNDNIAEARVINLDGGPIPPGETATMSFEIDDDKTLLSMASMLVTTNDAFAGANHLDLSKSRTLNLTAYDSGTEANSEDCAYIPGPPCGNHAKDDAESEGFVHVHAGIHTEDLDPATHDWRNPVARLSIKSWKLDK